MNYLAKFVVAFAVSSGALSVQAETPAAPRLSELNPNDSILKDVYVRLYLSRLQFAKLGIERAKANLGVAYKARDRREKLFLTRTITAEELEQTRREVELAAIAVQQAEASANEAEIFVDIAISRVSLGLEMPICAQLQ